MPFPCFLPINIVMAYFLFDEFSLKNITNNLDWPCFQISRGYKYSLDCFQRVLKG